MSEYDLQRFVVDLLRLESAPGVIAYHVPNGELRSRRTAGRLKAMGVVAGVADIALVLPGGHAAFLELKAPKGRLSPEQRAFRDDVIATGGRFAVAASPEEAVAALLGWGAISRDPLQPSRSTRLLREVAA